MGPRATSVHVNATVDWVDKESPKGSESRIAPDLLYDKALLGVPGTCCKGFKLQESAAGQMVVEVVGSTRMWWMLRDTVIKKTISSQ